MRFGSPSGAAVLDHEEESGIVGTGMGRLMLSKLCGRRNVVFCCKSFIETHFTSTIPVRIHQLDSEPSSQTCAYARPMPKRIRDPLISGSGWLDEAMSFTEQFWWETWMREVYWKACMENLGEGTAS